MRVSGLDSNDDWRFGKGRAVYKRQSEAINQNVVTRLRSFTNDWFVDINNGIPWFDLLGERGTERRILRAIERTVLQTEGVLSIERLQITSRDRNRGVVIELSYTDVFGASTTDNVTVGI